MNEWLQDPVSLKELAADMQLSESYFIRRYRKLTGVTPMQDFRRLRLERVRHFLLTTDFSLQDIAERCGLANGFHLGRLFREHYGMSPGRFRRWSQVR